MPDNSTHESYKLAADRVPHSNHHNEMASFKAVPVLCVLAVLAASVSATPAINSLVDPENFAKNESHNLVVGSRQYNDKLIYEENISESYQISGKKKIITRTIKAPANYVITQVRALDQITDGTGAEPTVTGGGPGLNQVSLRFKSQRWHGIYFRLEVYAKPY